MSAATTLLATAIADGADKLSPFDCAICLAYSYAGGVGAQTLLATAISHGLDKPPEEDMWRLAAYAASLGVTAQTALNSAIAAGYDGFSNGDIREILATALGLNDQTVLASAIAAGFDKLSARDLTIVLVQGLCTTNGVSTTTLEANMIAAGFDRPSIRDVKMILIFFLNNAAPVAPVITQVANVLTWTYAGTLPPFWVTQESANGVSGWVSILSNSSADPNWLVDATKYHRIGGSQNGIAITGTLSNVAGPANLRITEAGDLRVTEAGDFRAYN